jgi:hypothetical protein
MIIKMLWEKCPEFVVEEEDAFFIEASLDETVQKILPALSAQERIKFDQLKDIYVAKETMGLARGGSFYFLVSRGAQAIKFESVSFLSSDFSARGGRVRSIADRTISELSEIESIDPRTL